MFTKPDPNSQEVTKVTKEEQKATIAALLEERNGYELRELAAKEKGDDEEAKVMKERLGLIDAQLKSLGGAAEKPATRAQKRPAAKAASKR